MDKLNFLKSLEVHKTNCTRFVPGALEKKNAKCIKILDPVMTNSAQGHSDDRCTKRVTCFNDTYDLMTCYYRPVATGH
jgi:hypothetical protein